MSSLYSKNKDIIAFAVKYGGRECLYEQKKYIISGYAEVGGYNKNNCKVFLCDPDREIVDDGILEVWNFINTSNNKSITHGMMVERLDKIRVIGINKVELEKIIKALEL